MKPLELMEQGRFLGEEFLLWLWMRSMTEGGTSGEEGDGSGLYLDDQIQLVSERGEVKQISLAKGNPSECREAFEALSRGMRPSKMKVRILSGDLEWVGTLDAAGLRLNALKMPPSSGKAPQDRLHDRLFLLEEGHAHLERRFKRFLVERMDDQGEALVQQLMVWVKAGLAGEAMPAGEAPWEQPGPAGVVKAIQISEQLLATHRSVRNLHPETWREDLKPFMQAILHVQKEKGISILSAGQQVAEEILEGGANPMLALAAAVELVMPTPVGARPGGD